MFLCRRIPNTSLCLARAEAAGRQAAGSGQRAVGRGLALCCWMGLGSSKYSEVILHALSIVAQVNKIAHTVRSSSR